MMKKFFSCMAFIACLQFLSPAILQAQTGRPYWNDIESFKKQDSVLMPPTGKILMIGSSSFTFWQDVGRFLPGYPFINRGFGGSSLIHLIDYFDDIVKPYKPRQILIYCGENDLGGNVNGDTVFHRFQTLFNMIRRYDKKVLVTYVSMKPSPSRAHLMKDMETGNRKIQEWLQTQKKAQFVDVYHLMLDGAGNPISEIFRDDKLHMNDKGYWIWAKAIAPYLLKN